MARLICVIESTRNNVFITMYEGSNNIVMKGSIGLTGNKGTKKKSEFSAAALGTIVGKRMLELGYGSTSIRLSGCWRKGENGCITGLKNSNLIIDEIVLLRRKGHNGVRNKKMRRK